MLGTALVFITGLGFLTFRAISDQGITLLTLLSVLILALLAIGIVGALRNPPR